MDLPDLVLLEVFSFLSVEERFGTLRLVCRKWKQVVEFQIQKDMVVYEDEIPFKNRWPSNNRQVDLLDTVTKPFFNFYLIRNRYKAIKRLFFHRINWNGFPQKGLMPILLECMCQLEELSIDQSENFCLDWVLGGDESKNREVVLNGLILPNLRVLSVKQYFCKKTAIIVPRLRKLVVWDFFYTQNRESGLMISVSHPERLSSLQCQQIDNETGIFSNLEQLAAEHVKRDFELSHHPKLKRLDLCVHKRFSVNESDFYSTIEALIERRRVLKMNDLQITNLGAKDDVTERRVFGSDFPGSCGIGSSELEFFVRNFTIDYLPWVIQFDGSAYGHPGLGELARRSLNIERVSVNEYSQPDPNLLLKFLVQIGGVKCLSISRCSFSRNFYDQLRTVPYIGILSINTVLPSTDFKFIYRIKFLNELWIRLTKDDLDLFGLALKRSKIREFLIAIHCIHERLPIRLAKKHDSRFVLQPLEPEERVEFDCYYAAFAATKKRCHFIPENPSI